MRLLVDDRWFGHHGIGRFAKEVVRRLPKTISIPAGIRPTNPVDSLWTSACLALIRPDVYFTPGYNPPIVSLVPFVFTVHDLIHLHIETETSAAKRFYYEEIVRPALFRASRILTVSQFSKTEIINWSGVPHENIVVVGNGVSEGLAPAGGIHAEDRPYLLYIGSRKPHKNVPKMLRAFRAARLAPDVVLLCSGARDTKIMSWIADARLQESSVRFAGTIPEHKLGEYYRGALGVLMPSLYEGFGLPALEAMACGTPVLAGNCTAVPEIVGHGGLLVDPFDTEAITDGIQRLVQETTLREQLKALGLRQASLFNWDTTAGKVLKALQGAASGSPSS